MKCLSILLQEIILEGVMTSYINETPTFQ